MLAERTDLSRVYISYIELGIRKPSLESLVKISQVLNTNIDNILIGNIPQDENGNQYNLNYLLNDCNNYEKRIIIDTIKSLKTSFINNRGSK